MQRLRSVVPTFALVAFGVVLWWSLARVSSPGPAPFLGPVDAHLYSCPVCSPGPDEDGAERPNWCPEMLQLQKDARARVIRSDKAKGLWGPGDHDPDAK